MVRGTCQRKKATWSSPASTFSASSAETSGFSAGASTTTVTGCATATTRPLFVACAGPEASTTGAGFELLQHFAVALGQRLVDYHKDQRYLQQFFAPEIVSRLLQVRDYQSAYLTPRLRDVAMRGPYMHDGSEKTLEAVVAFYNRGGNKNPWLSSDVRPLNLAAQEQQDLVAFLKALTGEIDPEVGKPPTLPK